ncbi:hypothetical protein RRG08_014849 [Elysia crispata]|uniref:Uncharacterized protein n=1 Tax=Elysia crispata TaxID=231223 RepID=A0AAE0Z6Q0_9GAST|nr:hypothetical protein RRG08_014849 [Elysia crispata]
MRGDLNQGSTEINAPRTSSKPASPDIELSPAVKTVTTRHEALHRRSFHAGPSLDSDTAIHTDTETLTRIVGKPGLTAIVPPQIRCSPSETWTEASDREQ